jgi:hypothetical protein
VVCFLADAASSSVRLVCLQDLTSLKIKADVLAVFFILLTIVASFAFNVLKLSEVWPFT